MKVECKKRECEQGEKEGKKGKQWDIKIEWKKGKL